MKPVSWPDMTKGRGALRLKERRVNGQGRCQGGTSLGHAVFCSESKTADGSWILSYRRRGRPVIVRDRLAQACDECDESRSA